MSVRDDVSSSWPLGSTSLLSIINECKGSLQQRMPKRNTKSARGSAMPHSKPWVGGDAKFQVVVDRSESHLKHGAHNLITKELSQWKHD